MNEDPCTPSTPGPSTDELRARYQFRCQPMPSLSLGELSDLLLAHVAGELSEGALTEITGIGRLELRAMHLKAIARSDELWRSWRESEERRFRATFASPPVETTDTASSTSAPDVNSGSG
jgi:hypothetical protein